MVMEISSVSDWEYINLIGQYVQIETGKTDQIDPRLLARGFSEEQIQMMKKDMDKGSTSEAIALNLHFKKLGKWNYQYFDYVFTLFNKYDKYGTLPFPNSHSEQPSKMMELFGVLSQLRHESQEKAHNKQAKETERKNKVNGQR